MGMAHGNYVFRNILGEDVLDFMPKAGNTAYTEFGCPGPSSAEYLKSFIPEEELFPPRPGTAWETHHAFCAWGRDTWLTPGTIEYYYGPSNTLEELVRKGQTLQCEGYKCIYEEARRQTPRCSMALNWCYNEPWPSAANNSLVNWPAVPKPALKAVEASLRPFLASARIPKYKWEEGDLFNPELWILNDSPDTVEGNCMEVLLKLGNEETLLLVWNYPHVAPNTNLPGPVIRFRLPSAYTDRMELVLRVADNSVMDSSYTLAYRSKAGIKREKIRMMNM
jgi:beta-mannosidase